MKPAGPATTASQVDLQVDNVEGSTGETSNVAEPSADRQTEVKDTADTSTDISPVQIPTASTDSATDVRQDADAGAATADDVIKDADDEVSEILHASASAPGPVDDEDGGQMITEIIMAKTFTESILPDQEFVPIDAYAADPSRSSPAQQETVDKPTPVAEPAAASDEDNRKYETPAGEPSTTVQPAGSADTNVEEASRSSVREARGQLRDLTSEFRHLQSLLDELTSPLTGTGSSSDDDLMSEEASGADAGSSLPRVIYRYHVPAAPRRRWLKRDDVDSRPEVESATGTTTFEQKSTVDAEQDQQHPTSVAPATDDLASGQSTLSDSGTVLTETTECLPSAEQTTDTSQS